MVVVGRGRAGADEDGGLEEGTDLGRLVVLADSSAREVVVKAVEGPYRDELVLFASEELGEGFIEESDIGIAGIGEEGAFVAFDFFEGCNFAAGSLIDGRGHELGLVGDLWERVVACEFGKLLDEGLGAGEEGALVIAGVEPDFGGGGGGGDVDDLEGVVRRGADRGELVVVEVGDGGLGGQFWNETKQVGEVHGLAGEEEIDPPYPVTGELLGEPVSGGGEAAFDAARWKPEEGPVMAAVAHDGFEHRLSHAAEERLEGEDVELGEHGDILDFRARICNWGERRGLCAGAGFCGVWRAGRGGRCDYARIGSGAKRWASRESC